MERDGGLGEIFEKAEMRLSFIAFWLFVVTSCHRSVTLSELDYLPLPLHPQLLLVCVGSMQQQESSDSSVQVTRHHLNTVKTGS